MQLHGSIVENLNHAANSARRLRGHTVYRETLAHWNGVLEEARKVRLEPSCADAASLDAAIARLEAELADRED